MRKFNALLFASIAPLTEMLGLLYAGNPKVPVVAAIAQHILSLSCLSSDNWRECYNAACVLRLAVARYCLFTYIPSAPQV
jgi:hypothetical protein